MDNAQKQIGKDRKMKWLPILLLIPSATGAFICALLVGFFVANAYQSEEIGVEVARWIFAVGTPLPILLYRKNIFSVVKNKAFALLTISFLQILLIGLFYFLISSVWWAV